MLNFIRATGARSKFVFLALFLALSAISIYAVNAAFTRTDSIRLSPLQFTVTPESGLPADVKNLELESLALVFDRDTNTEYVAYGQSQLELSFDKVTEIHTLKVFAAAPYDISVKALVNNQWQSVDGLTHLDLSSLTPFWHSYQVANPVTTDQLQISFKSSTGGQATGLKELEIWGQAERVTVNTGANLLASIETDNPVPQARFYGASQSEAIIGNVEGLEDQTTDNSFSISLDRDPRSIKRAWLSYESHGAGHWVSAVRDVNGFGDLGGSYRFASSAWSGQLEQDQSTLVSAGQQHCNVLKSLKPIVTVFVISVYYWNWTMVVITSSQYPLIQKPPAIQLWLPTMVIILLVGSPMRVPQRISLNVIYNWNLINRSNWKVLPLTSAIVLTVRSKLNSWKTVSGSMLVSMPFWVKI